MCVSRTLRHVRVTIDAVEKQYYILWVFVALGTQHDTSNVPSPALQYFPHYLIRGIIKKVFEHKKCVFIFSNNLLKNFSFQE